VRYLLLTIFLASSLAGVADESLSVPAKPPLDIKILEAKWGEASLNDIHAVLTSTANQLWPHAAQKKLDTILVNRSTEGPIVLFRRGDKGQYFVNLATSHRFWAQYAFQFAHEFGHIMCNYKAGSRENQWFEETICETASLFALGRMSKTWEHSPPYRNWKSYAKHLGIYLKERIDEHPWPKSTSIASWYRQNAKILSENHTERKLNTTLATQLLPLFEEKPERWKAVAYLNAKKTSEPRDFYQFLKDWNTSCPADDRELPTKIIQLFEFDPPPTER